MEVPLKKKRLDDCPDSDNKLEAFNKWLDSENIVCDNKVSIVKGKCCAQYGMIANEDIPASHLLFTIPRKSTLSPENCAISKLLNLEQEALRCESGWVPLLVAILHEYMSQTSRWKPYLDLFFVGADLQHPMYLTNDVMKKELTGTGIVELVEKDLKNMEEEFYRIVLPFIEKHEEYFGKEARDFNLYKRLVGFVMAYSFTEPLKLNEAEEEIVKLHPPIMVPVADVLNHVSKNNANLTFEESCLKMISVKPIKKGEEIFNTYGELSNSQLFHMYGFAENYPENIFDSVEITNGLLLEAFKDKLTPDEQRQANDKWQFIEDLGMVSEFDSFAIGPEGILTDEELFNTLKVLFMSESEFKDFKEKKGWSEDEEDESEEMSNESLSKLPEKWRDLISRLMVLRLSHFKETLEDDELLLRDNESLSSLQKWALYVRYSQKKLLNNIIDLCRKTN